MISFILCCAIIIGGYFTYCKLVENIFGPDDRETPAVAINDGVDYVVMPQWKMFLIQLLNIAGLGPINGALGGAFWGPAVYLWITFGTVFAGCVHDYFSGMLSERNNGASISEVVNTYLGKGMGNVMRVFAVVLLVMVGTVFAVGPAGLLRVLLTRNGVDGNAVYAQTWFWLIIIIVYYFISTFVPIDKVIGRIYPVFGICLIVMAIGVGIGVVRLNGSDAVGMGDYYKRTIQEQFEREAGQYEGAVANSGYETYIALADSLGVAEENRWDEARFNAAAAEGRAETVKIRDENDEMMAADATNALYAAYADMGVTVKMPELWDNFRNLHPTGQPIWSFMFITVACGALSGFHATQSPMMARCLKSERQGRFVFSGAMTAEGIIAMVWAAAGCTFFGSSGLNNLFANVTKLTDGRLGAGNGTTVYNISVLTMGGFGAIIAMLGVIACPITSGDTAFRSARLTLADWFKIDQGDTKKRLMLTIPVLGVGAFLAFGNTFGFVDYEVIWRYFAWTNQTLAMIVLWAAAMYLAKEKKNFWICALPATFMSAVSITYFCMAGETLGMIEFFKNNTSVAYPAGIIAAAAFFGLFWWKSGKYRKAEATA